MLAAVCVREGVIVVVLVILESSSSLELLVLSVGSSGVFSASVLTR